MWIYLVAVAIIWLLKIVYSEYVKDIDIEVSQTLVPMIQNSINALGLTSGLIQMTSFCLISKLRFGNF